ncbi:type III PLP-dependent enzyme [Streptomyces sp. B6B3]|uniref:type III PLP-dependent enzyme n=1 Tax=Streptomyces sp. B6B3 TaxID=3153570 RepID=UPI00325F275C
MPDAHPPNPPERAPELGTPAYATLPNPPEQPNPPELPNLPERVHEVGTPAYVYDLDEVERCHRTLVSALPRPSRLYYSLKANPHPAVVTRLSGLGCSLEVSSPGELATALKSGVPPETILYTGPGKRDAEVRDAVAAGVRWFSVDSPHGIDQVDRAAETAAVTARCLLRLNGHEKTAGQGLTMTGVASQFGADVEWLVAEPAAFASRPRARVSGLHLYLGSNLLDEDELVAQFAAALRTAETAHAVLPDRIEVLDLGGGFGAPFARSGRLPDLPTLGVRLASLLDDAFAGWRGGRPVVAFESGRFLTATCGSLLTRAVDVKRSHGTQVVVLESGINHLGGMSGLRRLPPLLPELVPGRGAAGRDTGQDSGQGERSLVTGPLCTPLDTWARAAVLPPVRPGDVLRVPNVGAYGLTASLTGFLGHPAPLEVIVEGGEIAEVSRLVWERNAVNRAEVS